MGARHHTQRGRSRPLLPPPPPAMRTHAEGNVDDNKGKDPVDDFFKTAKKPMLASLIVDGMAADVQEAVDAVVAAPLQFNENSMPVPEGEAL